MRSRGLTRLCLVLGFLLIGPARVLAETDPVPVPTPDTVAACQQAILSTGDTFVAKRVKSLGACANGVLACLQTSPEDAVCLASAGVACEKALLKLARRRARFIRGLLRSCGADHVVAGDLLGGGGLGYEALAGECGAELGSPPGEVRAIVRCVAEQHACQAEQLLDARQPRAKELMRHAGIAADRLAQLSCLPDHGGEGAHVSDTVTGRAVTRCVARVTKGGAKLAAITHRRLARCIARLFRCDRETPADPACLDGARQGCARAFTRIAAAEAQLAATVALRCGRPPLGFDVLAGPAGANLVSLAGECEAHGTAVGSLAEYAECLRRQHACRVEDLLRFEAPRAEELLGRTGRPLRNAFCPAASPTPTPTARPGETATPSATRTLAPSVTATPVPTPSATPVCGNGVAEGDENCDGTDLDDNDCEDLCDEEGGALGCRPDCTYDFSACTGSGCEAP